MKSIIKNNNVSKELGFPKLMVDNDNTVVLISYVREYEQGVGIVIYSDNKSDYKIGYNSQAWNLNYFKDFNGTVELSN